MSNTATDTASKPRTSHERIQLGDVEMLLWRQPESETGRVCIAALSHVNRSFRARAGLSCPTAVFGMKDLLDIRVGAEEMAQRLINGIDLVRNAKEIVLVGVSGGGFAMMIIGMALARLLAPKKTRVRVIAMNPPSWIWPIDEGRTDVVYQTMVRHVENNPALKARLEAEGELKPWLYRTAETAGANFRAVLVVSAQNARDVRHADAVRGAPGVSVITVPTSDHAASLLWLNAPQDADDAILREAVWAHMNQIRQRVSNTVGEKGDGVDPVRLDRAVASLKAYRKWFPDLAALVRWMNNGRGDLVVRVPRAS